MMTKKEAGKIKTVSASLDNLSSTYYVEKSKTLLSYLTSSMSIGEYRLLDTYLSRINARTDNKVEVTFSKKEYEKLLSNGNPNFRLRNDDLNKHVAKLSQRQVNLEKFSDNGTTNLVNLFSSARTEFTEKGELVVVLRCNSDVKPLFFDIAKKGYIKYQLKNVLLLKSMNAINIYNYLLANANRREWEISIEAFLCNALFMKDNEYYKSYYVLNSKILKKSIEEINSKTNLTVEYRAGSKGGKQGNLVKSIVFTIIRKDNMVYAESVSDGILTNDDNNSCSDILNKIIQACEKSFDNKMAQCLYDKAKAVDRDYILKITGCSDYEEALINLITDKYHQAVMYKAKNLYSYTVKLIEKEQGKKTTSENEHRSYDIDDLDKIDTLDDYEILEEVFK